MKIRSRIVTHQDVRHIRKEGGGGAIQDLNVN